MKTTTKFLYLLLFLALPHFLLAQGELVLQKVKEANNDIKVLQGYLREHPELPGQEFKTTLFLQAEMEKLGLAITRVPGTGFYAVLDTQRPGKTIGLRADIDALPIPENPNNLKQKKLHISQNDGVSHACGHDGHMTIVLEAAKILTEIKEQLSGKIIFIFEEGEETGSGIDAMVEALTPIPIDAVYGNHLKSNLESGKLFIQEGAIMAGTGTLAFDVIGRGGHASRPDLSINPVFAAAHILTGISIAWNNQRDITKTVTLGITQLQGSELSNIIPNKAFVGGTIRYFDKEEAQKCFDLIQSVSEHIAAAHHCSVVFHETHALRHGPVINDTALTLFTREAVRQIYPDRVVSGDAYIWYASESFSKYSQLAPTVFVFPGIKNEAFGSGAEHHNDQFDIDPESLQYAVGAMVQFAVNSCARHQSGI
ncbi:MAG: amidohydrolase [Bacteroidales bacterium]|nr:amidohydrolase [Bacteroidales bacterium]